MEAWCCTLDSECSMTIGTSKSSLSGVAPLEVVLFDIDGTLCDSDQIHYYAFREMLPEIGFNGGVPITEEYYIENFAGKHNDDVARILFPDDLERGLKFTEDKEAMFRRLAVDKLKPVNGLYKVKKWIEDRGLKRTKSMTSLELILMFQHPIWAPMLRPSLNIYF
ncbi:hypothetical protein ACFX13_016629 [Malus domestica]|uniref:haloacid dehalogenase-like hydrolase domain-containing protein Sgpp isoform X1 n=1 Tax=Malus domestica TaxID=3750 RepID=UPI0004990451|nr:haloacid dehalogenase-like hydrolase domain-containing protein Sgpp [Malus domestica]